LIQGNQSEWPELNDIWLLSVNGFDRRRSAIRLSGPSLPGSALLPLLPCMTMGSEIHDARTTLQGKISHSASRFVLPFLSLKSAQRPAAIRAHEQPDYPAVHTGIPEEDNSVVLRTLTCVVAYFACRFVYLAHW
jgi:hypothetical protein